MGVLLLVDQVVVVASFCENLGVVNVMCGQGSQLACFDGKPLVDHPPQVLQPWLHLHHLQRPEQSPQVPQPLKYLCRLELPQQLDFGFAACQLLALSPAPQWTPPQHHV